MTAYVIFFLRVYISIQKFRIIRFKMVQNISISGKLCSFKILFIKNPEKKDQDLHKNMEQHKCFQDW